MKKYLIAFAVLFVGCASTSETPVQTYLQKVSVFKVDQELHPLTAGAEIAYKRALLSHLGMDPDAPFAADSVAVFERQYMKERSILERKTNRRYGLISPRANTPQTRVILARISDDFKKIAEYHNEFLKQYDHNNDRMLSKAEIVKLSDNFRTQLAQGKTLGDITYDYFDRLDSALGRPADRFEIVSGFLQPKTERYAFVDATRIAYQNARMRNLNIDPDKLLSESDFERIDADAAVRQKKFYDAFRELYNFPSEHEKRKDPRAMRAANDYARAMMQYHLNLRVIFDSPPDGYLTREELEGMAAKFFSDLKKDNSPEDQLLKLLRVLHAQPEQKTKDPIQPITELF